MKGSIVTIDGGSGLRDVIGGREADAADGRPVEVVDPGAGSERAEASEPGAEASAPVPLRVLDAVEGHTPAGVQCRAAGRPVRMTLDEEVPPMVDDLRLSAGAAGDRTEHRTSSVRWEPTGGCTQATPWIPPMTTVPTAGGAVTLRPSRSAAEFLSAGVFTVVRGDRDTGRAMADHPIPQAVSNTESAHADMAAVAAAAEELRRVRPEPGGTTPAVVFDDAESAATGIAAAGRPRAARRGGVPQSGRRRRRTRAGPAGAGARARRGADRRPSAVRGRTTR